MRRLQRAHRVVPGVFRQIFKDSSGRAFGKNSIGGQVAHVAIKVPARGLSGRCLNVALGNGRKIAGNAKLRSMLWRQEKSSGELGRKLRKTKLTQGASVNTPRHCSEMFLYFLRLLAARQAANFSLKLAQLPDPLACRIF
jgi:hypothetical protein